MGRIIGYADKNKYKHVCSKCGAIVVFEEDELVFRNGFDGNFYGIGRCPNCESGVNIDLQNDVYDESGGSLQEWPKISNCIRDCKHCPGKCLYRREEYKAEEI